MDLWLKRKHRLSRSYDIKLAFGKTFLLTYCFGETPVLDDQLNIGGAQLLEVALLGISGWRELGLVGMYKPYHHAVVEGATRQACFVWSRQGSQSVFQHTWVQG